MKRPVSLTRLLHALLAAGAFGLAAPAVSVHAADGVKSPIEAASQDALWNGDFEEVERQNAYFKLPNRFEADGVSQLAEFRFGLNTVFDNRVEHVETYLKNMDALTLQWATQHPKSALAHTLHAKALITHGWSYRGGAYSNEVPPEAMREFEKYLQQALDYLKAHADVALTDSYAHVQLLEIGMAMSWNKAQMLAIVDDGLKRNPDDSGLYFQMETRLLPKWGGTPRELDDFIRQSTERTRARFGTGMYAFLYLSAADSQFDARLFEDSFADWDKLKQAFDDLDARYPGSDYRLNAYAHMACLAKDKPTLTTLLGRIGTRINTKGWGKNPEANVELCRRWATQS
jgi:hypothetical protein